jgi:magnesium transporter
MTGGLIGGILANLPRNRRRNDPNRASPFVFGEGLMKPPLPLSQGQNQSRTWLEITPDGASRSLMLSKIKTIQQFQLPLRDLRILDPMLATSYPSALLAREKSIIVNMEFIKMVIGLDSCYVTNLEDPNSANFVDHLQERLKGLAGKPDSEMKDKEVYLPFELRVLETALDYVSKYLEQQVTDVEAATHPALDALTQTISTSNLERVRRIKNRMVRLNLRIETLKEVLERTLDDDADMKDFNLSALEEERLEEVNRELQRFSSTPFDMPMVTTSSSLGKAAVSAAANATVGGPGYSSSSSSDTSLDSDEDVEVVEQLLESYFMRLDNTWNRMQTLSEYVDDTEDFINIELDSHRNQLIRLDIVLTTFTTSMALITAVTALFAMNVDLRPNNDDKAPYSWFVIITSTTASGALALFTIVLAYCKWRKLM